MEQTIEHAMVQLGLLQSTWTPPMNYTPTCKHPRDTSLKHFRTYTMQPRRSWQEGAPRQECYRREDFLLPYATRGSNVKRVAKLGSFKLYVVDDRGFVRCGSCRAGAGRDWCCCCIRALGEIDGVYGRALACGGWGGNRRPRGGDALCAAPNGIGAALGGGECNGDAGRESPGIYDVTTPSYGGPSSELSTALNIGGGVLLRSSA